MNTPRFSRYKTFEASMNKRLSNRWSAQVGGSHTWAHDFPGNVSEQPRTARSTKTRRAGTSSCRAPMKRRTASASRRWCVTRRARTSRARSRSAPAMRHRGRRHLQRHDQRRAARTRAATTTSRCSTCASIAASTSAHGMRVRGFFDLFNITNSNAAETRTITTGTASCARPRCSRRGRRASAHGCRW